MGKKLYASVLAICMAACLFVNPLSAMAAETDDGTDAAEILVEAAASDSEESEADCIIVYDINPLYEDVISEEDLELPDEELHDEAVAVAASEYYTTVEEAAEVLREGMTEREESVSFSYLADEYSGSYFYEILTEAFSHTGEPDEGDYLLWTYAGCSGSLSGRSYSGGYLITFTYTISYYTTLEQEEEVEETIAEILGEWDLDEMTDYDKVTEIYDYICANVTYDYTNLYDDDYTLKHTAYAALINGTAVCQGYACLFYRMTLTAGVDSRIIAGYAYASSTTSGHAWNIVKICDDYYYLDSTWDAGRSSYKYFLLGTTNFTQSGATHVAWTTENGSSVTYGILEEIMETYLISDTDCDTDTVHSYVTEVVGATCTEDGYTSHICSICGDSYISDKQEGTATGHSYTSVVTDPTCTENGYTTYTCSVCGDSYVSDETAALGHSYVGVVTEPTCTETGYTTYTCSVCGDSYVSDETAALGHDYVGVVTEPTCTETGYTTYTCSVCGDSYIADATAATGHSYTSVITKAATCTTDGVRTYTCTACGETYTETIAATGHSYEAVVTDPTCTEDGYTTYTCSVCGDTYVDDETAAFGHSYVGVVTEPTCTETGYTTYTCSECGDSYIADATAATGHSYTSAITTAVTCTTDGVRTYTCTACGDTYTETIAATGHSYEAVVTDPTCTTDGYTTYTCSVCGESYIADATAATGHTEGDPVVTTTDTEITYSYYCTVCGELIRTETEAVSSDDNGTDNSGSTDDDGSTDDSGSADDDGSTDNSGSADDDGSTDNSGSTDDDGSTDNSGSTDDDGTTDTTGTTPGSSYTVPDKSIAPGKVDLTGATEEQVTATLAKLTSDDDLAGSSYSLLQAKAAKTTKNSVKLTWKKVSGAKSYVIYANQCGSGKKFKKYKTVTGTSLNIKKIAGKKVTKGKYYKFLVVALDENGEVIATSKTVHAATKGGKYTNQKSVSLYKGSKKISKVSLKAGKTVKIKAKTTLQQKSKKFQQHRTVKYESSDTNIATVNSKGKIKAKAKGTCYIYAYAQNGVSTKIKVTVK